VGLWRARGNPWFLATGMVAVFMLLVYNAVAYRELIRQGEGGEVLKVRWWFTRGASLKRVFSENAPEGPRSLGSRLFALLAAVSRRDFFVFAWLVLALLDLGPVILVYAFLLALANFVAAVGQLVFKA
jgi:hypothetical protein